MEWRAVPSWPGVEVSDAGDVRSPRGPMRAFPGHGGHLRTYWRGRNAYVHRLVLEAFRGPCPANEEARHLNDVPTDNRLENLAWGTRRENLLDRRVTGHVHRMPGEQNPAAKLRADDLATIRRLRAGGLSQQAIAEKMHVNQTTVSRILRGRLWAEGA